MGPNPHHDSGSDYNMSDTDERENIIKVDRLGKNVISPCKQAIQFLNIDVGSELKPANSMLEILSKNRVLAYAK